MVSYTNSEMMNQRQHNGFQYQLHSVNQSSASRISKKPLTSQSQAPAASGHQKPKVYMVKPIHFRELVQKLTGAGAQRKVKPQPELQSQPQPQPRRSSLQSVAPPPLPFHPHQLRLQNQTHTSTVEEQVPCPKPERALPALPVDQKPLLNKIDGGEGSNELMLSPNFQTWFSFALLSPGPATVSQMEQRSLV